jgi:hypothetical protein
MSVYTHIYPYETRVLSSHRPKVVLATKRVTASSHMQLSNLHNNREQKSAWFSLFFPSEKFQLRSKAYILELIAIKFQFNVIYKVI